MYTVSLVTPRELNPDCVINVFSTVCILPGHCDISHCFRDVGCNSQACTYTSSGIVPVAHNATYHTVRNPKSLITVLTQNLISCFVSCLLSPNLMKIYLHFILSCDRDISLAQFKRLLKTLSLYRAAALSDCCFVVPCTNILTYLLTYLLTYSTNNSRQRAESVVYLGRTSAFLWIGLLTLILCDAISLNLHQEPQETRHKYSPGAWTLLERFQGQRSKVKVASRPNAIFWHRDSHQPEAY